MSFVVLQNAYSKFILKKMEKDIGNVEKVDL